VVLGRVVLHQVVPQMVLLVVLHRCTFLVQASLRLVALSIQMEYELFCPFHLHLVDLVGQALLLDTMLHHRHLLLRFTKRCPTWTRIMWMQPLMT
jgi:hypothetical protein